MLSIIIPCRNEEKFISKCLDSILANNYLKTEVEILVVDGMSEDDTRRIVKNYSKKHPFIRLMDNYKRITPVALNIGIKAAQKEYILILSSHSEVGKNFIEKNIEAFSKYNADCVGGIIITIASYKNIFAQCIAIALSHPFGVGNSYFRIGSKVPKYVDTVPFGCYKREVFNKNGLFNEDLVRNQDDEFNLRLVKNGGRVLLVPDIVSYYYARDSLSKLWKMYYQYGYFKPLVAQKVGSVLTLRQLIPALFVGSFITSTALAIVFKLFFWLSPFILSLYLITSLAFSFDIAIRKGLRYFLVLPLVFLILHVSYGIGYLKGIGDFLVLRKNRRKKIKDLPLTR